MGLQDLMPDFGGDSEQQEQETDIDEADPERVPVPSEALGDIRRINSDLTSAIYKLGELQLEMRNRKEAIFNSIDNLVEHRQEMAEDVESDFIPEESESDYILNFDANPDSNEPGELVREDVAEDGGDGGVPVDQDEPDDVDPVKDGDS